MTVTISLSRELEDSIARLVLEGFRGDDRIFTHVKEIFLKYFPQLNMNSVLADMESNYRRSEFILMLVAKEDYHPRKLGELKHTNRTVFRDRRRQIVAALENYGGEVFQEVEAMPLPWSGFYTDCGILSAFRLRGKALIAFARLVYVLKEQLGDLSRFAFFIPHLRNFYSAFFVGSQLKTADERMVLQALFGAAFSSEQFPLEELESYISLGMAVTGLHYASEHNSYLISARVEAEKRWLEGHDLERVERLRVWMVEAMKGLVRGRLSLVPSTPYAFGDHLYEDLIPTPLFEVADDNWKVVLGPRDSLPITVLSGQIGLKPLDIKKLPLFPQGKLIEVEGSFGPMGCLAGDERIVLANGTVEKIKDMGAAHLQEISWEIRTGKTGQRARAVRFFRYPPMPMLEIITDSGRSLRGTYNHLLLTMQVDRKRPNQMVHQWKHLDEITVGDRVRVVESCYPWPRPRIQRVRTEWITPKTKHRKFQIKLPASLDENLAGLLGLLVADGSIHKGREVLFYIGEDESDIIQSLREIVRELFGAPISVRRKDKTKRMWLASIHRTPVARALMKLDGVKEGRVPELIWQSRNAEAASFLRWLFQGDGSVNVSLKKQWNTTRYEVVLASRNVELLRDVQLLLMRWGIHSRVTGYDAKNPSLIIARAEAVLRFADAIGFVGEAKRAKLKTATLGAERAMSNKHRSSTPRYEKVAKVRRGTEGPVYDIEVPTAHQFVANGFVVHNSGKTVLGYALDTTRIKSGYVIFQPAIKREQAILCCLPSLPVSSQAKTDHDYLTRMLRIRSQSVPCKFLTICEDEDQLNPDAVWTVHDQIILVNSLEQFSLDWNRILADFPRGQLIVRHLRSDTETNIMRAALIPDFFHHRESNRRRKIWLRVDELQDILPAQVFGQSESQIQGAASRVLGDIRGLNLPFSFSAIRPVMLQPEVLEMCSSIFFSELRVSGAEASRSTKGRLIEVIRQNLLSDQDRLLLPAVERIMENRPLANLRLFFWAARNQPLRLVSACLPPHMCEATNVDLRTLFEKAEEMLNEKILVSLEEVPRMRAVRKERKERKEEALVILKGQS